MNTLTINSIPEQKVEEATDLSVFVRTSTDDIVAWERAKIVEALVRETGIHPEIAGIIAIEVEKQLRAMSVKNITAPLIRELVDVKLLEYGQEDARRKHTRLGVPVYDVKKIIFHKNKENANTPHSPEATNLTLAENIKKYGGFITGIRPGKPTAQYLEYTITRLTLVGATFLAIIAVVPSIVESLTHITSFQGLGSTSLLIVVGVALDLVRQIETHLVTRQYEGLLA